MDEVVEQDAMNFAWSFRPIFIWFFAIFGVNLDESKAKPRCAMFLPLFISLFWILCLRIPLYSLRIYNEIIFDDPGITSMVFIINNNIICIISGLVHMILPITIICLYFWKWKPFWRKLQELGNAIGDEGEFYRQLRRETTGGLVLIFLVSGRCFTIVMFGLMSKEL